MMLEALVGRALLEEVVAGGVSWGAILCHQPLAVSICFLIAMKKIAFLCHALLYDVSAS
jgi:hypothetical protein